MPINIKPVTPNTARTRGVNWLRREDDDEDELLVCRIPCFSVGVTVDGVTVDGALVEGANVLGALLVGNEVGPLLGSNVGLRDGRRTGVDDGDLLGNSLGKTEGALVGNLVGPEVGKGVGTRVGDVVVATCPNIENKNIKTSDAYFILVCIILYTVKLCSLDRKKI